MEFTNEVLQKMESKQEFNKTVSGYFYRLYSEEGSQLKYLNLSQNVKDCCNCWVWDAYHINRILDLQKLNRCKNRFCSNCRKFDLSRALHNLDLPFRDLILHGYYPYLLTLTVPNCQGVDLNSVLDDMQKAYKKFWNWYTCDNKKGYCNRFIKFSGAVRCLEITYNEITGMYHPHYHILVFSEDYNFLDFEKKYQGEYSNKRKSYNMYSDLDMQIRQLWTIACTNKTLKDLKNLDEFYVCDIREMDDKGMYEVLKYAVKDTDIKNYYVFKDLYFGLYKRRIRQGYGLLHNVKLELESEGKKQNLEEYIKTEESPQQLVTTEIKTLYTQYSDYIKISRFSKDKFVDRLE